MEKMKYWLTTMAVLLCSITASALVVNINNISYSLNESALTAEVLRSVSYSGAMTIPTTVVYKEKEYVVTSIDDEAFAGYGDLKSITLPEGLMSIGNSAFLNCKGLTAITIPENVTSIGDDAFRYCVGLTTITIPENSKLASIGAGAFTFCSALTSVTLPENVTRIGNFAFSACTSLTAVNIPEGVTSIGSYAFDGCTSLATITCNAATPPTIYGTTFSNSITVYVPANSVEAYKSAEHWSEFTNIQPIIIASGTCGDNLTWELTDDGKLTIEGTGAMYSYGWSDSPLYSHRELITEVVIPEGVTNIGEGFFWDCTGLTEISIPAGVTSIDNYAFPGCRNLVSVSVPESVNSIGAFAFQSCEKLIDITIPEGVNSILNHTFQFCNSLASITIPAGVTSIGSHAFWGCSGLTSIICNAVTPPAIADEWTINEVDRSIPIYVPKSSVTTYKTADYWNAFANIQAIVSLIDSGTCGDNLTWKLTDDGKLTIEGTGAMYSYGWSDSPLYSHRELITEVVIPEGVTNIGEGVFWDCTGLTEITIPADVTSIDNYAFAGCRNLVSVSVPESVRSIGVYAFQNCNNLTAINIPEGVTSILNYAFENCNSLASITIPAGVTSICSHAFWGCSGLTSIICNAVTPPAVEDEWTLYDVNRSIPVYVPTAAIEDYKSAQYWSEFTNYQSLIIASGNCGDNLTWKYIDGGELVIEGTGTMNDKPWESYKGSITKVTIKEGVTSIVDWAFYQCSNLTEVSIAESVTHIGNDAFRECSNLSSLTLPEGLTHLGSGVFIQCYNLASIIIPDGVRNIYISTFDGCRNLSSVAIPAGMESISGWAFAWCSNLRTIVCKASTPPALDANALDGVDRNTAVYVLNASLEAYRAADGWRNFSNIQPISHSLTVSDAGYTTLYLDYAVEIPEEVKVYTATSVAGDRLKMTQVKGLLPAHTGVIVRAEEGTHLFHLSNESPNAIENNLLVGTTENTYIETQSTTKYYVLSRVDGVVGMYRAKIKDNGTFLNNANKAYLALDESNLNIFDDETNTDEEGGQLSNRLRFDFGGTTGIGNSQFTIDNSQLTIHDLHGRRITDTEGLKGVYIVNGKKVVFK